MQVDTRYIGVCAAAGLALGWIPSLLHGPSPDKFAILHIDGSAVWAWHLARSLIGLVVGVAALPRRWYVRGPLCGAAAILPLTLVSRAMPACGYPCMFWNLISASLLGLLVAAAAFAITGRSSSID